jgi:hypothetical protein
MRCCPHFIQYQGITSLIAYSHDSWTTGQMTFSFSRTIANFIDNEWNLVERLIDFSYVDIDDHQAAGAAASFVKSAAKRGGLEKISLS